MNVNISISGYWLEKHPEDFKWLEAQQNLQKLNITWVNHTYSHPYVKGIKPENNFLLLPKIDLKKELLKTEILLLKNGIIPTVFFRFPGLVADRSLMQQVADYGLIAIASDSWLAKGQLPKPGSFILVHANGNEPFGLTIFNRLYNQLKIPFPLFSLFEISSSQ